MERVPLEKLAKHFRVSLADAKAAQDDLGFLYRELAVEINGWQPVETAPDDGTSVLIADVRTQSYGEAYYDYAPDQKRWYWANTGAGDYPEPREPFPTHWMPLPAPPVEAKSEDV